MNHPKDLVPDSSGFSFVSYVSAANKGYYDDPYVTSIKARHEMEFLFDTDLSPDYVYKLSPLSNRNTYVRVLMKRTLVVAFLKNFKDELVQVISLGSGLDTFPFQLFTKLRSLPTIRYVEIDLQSVVQQKQYLTEGVLTDNSVFDGREWGSSHFCAWKAHPISLDNSFYHLQSCDLRNLRKLQRTLLDCRIDFSKPTLIFAEVALVYLEPSRCDDVIRFFAEKFLGPCCFLDFDHVVKEEEFGTSMQKVFAEMQLPLLGLEKHPSIDSQIKRFTELGWDRCSGLTMYEGLQKRLRKEEMLKLDEIEKVEEKERSEQILSHYGIILAAKGFSGREGFFASMDLENCRDELV